MNFLYQGRKGSTERNASWEFLGWFFLLYAGVIPPIPTASFYVHIIVWWHYGTSGYWKLRLPKGAKVTVKQTSMLLIICTFKIKIYFYIFKNGIKTPKMANLYSRKDIFIIRHLLWGKKPKTGSEWPHLSSGRFLKVF